VCLDDKLLTSDVDVSKLAVHTAGLLASDVGSLVQRATSRSLERTLQVLWSLDAEWAHPASLNYHGIVGGHVPLCNGDLTSALDSARFSYAEAIGAPKIPNVTWDDVGGLSSVKSDILDTIQLPLERPELFADGLKKRSGMILSLPTLPFTFLIMVRHSPLRSSGHGEDLTCKGSCDVLLPEFFVG
jgi:peroxin-6